MHRVHRSAIIAYSPKQMYDLVNDVESYPDFIPWCDRVEVKEHTDQTMRASIHIVKGPFSQSIATRNNLAPHETIEMLLEDGPFSTFHGTWRFEDLEQQATKVHFEAEFAFTSKMLDIMLGRFFDDITNHMIDAFCDRAKEIYK